MPHAADRAVVRGGAAPAQDESMEIIVPGTASLGLFVSAALVLLVVPGPAVLYIFARSVEQGRLAGFVSILGIHVATLVHVAAAALGLSAVLASSVLAFSLIKYVGAAYLIWLGLKRIFSQRQIVDVEVTVAGNGYWRLFRDGFLVNLLNPKTALFFFAFLPQFADVERGHLAMQIAAMGLIFTTLGIVTDSCYALAAGTIGNWLRRSPAYLQVERYVSGALFIGLGLTAALAEVQKK
jgi:threonine/homoserine/homoserine lactone efflux protein